MEVSIIAVSSGYVEQCVIEEDVYLDNCLIPDCM